MSVRPRRARRVLTAGLAGAVVAALVLGSPAGAGPAIGAGERLVFSSTRSGATSDLHALAPDGTVTRLTTSPTDDSQPAVSPDGKLVAFTRGVGQAAAPNAGDLFVIGVDGTGERALLADASTADFRPAWSPEGDRLVFARLSPDASASNLWTIGRDGTGLRQLTSAPGQNNYAGFAGPDRIVFNSNRDGAFKVWTMRADGTDAAAISSGPDTAPAVSPDGTRVAFRSLRSGTGLWVSGLDGSGPTQVTNGDDKFPAWSGDGTRLSFSRRDPACPANAGTFCPHRLHLVDLSTSEVTALPTTTGAVELFSAFVPSPATPPPLPTAGRPEDGPGRPEDGPGRRPGTPDHAGERPRSTVADGRALPATGPAAAPLAPAGAGLGVLALAVSALLRGSRVAGGD